jgi:hypothetical protein
VMIDDNQVQSLRVSWLDPCGPRVRFRLTLEATSPDEYLSREELFFRGFSDYSPRTLQTVDPSLPGCCASRQAQRAGPEQAPREGCG